jgi:superfamily II DNA/RNA helicase
VEILTGDNQLDFSSLAQFYEPIAEEDKLMLLERLLDFTPFSQAIIFTNTIQKTISVTQLLTNNMFNPITIHSGLSQQ